MNPINPTPIVSSHHHRSSSDLFVLTPPHCHHFLEPHCFSRPGCLTQTCITTRARPARRPPRTPASPHQRRQEHHQPPRNRPSILLPTRLHHHHRLIHDPLRRTPPTWCRCPRHSRSPVHRLRQATEVGDLHLHHSLNLARAPQAVLERRPPLLLLGTVEVEGEAATFVCLLSPLRLLLWTMLQPPPGWLNSHR